MNPLSRLLDPALVAALARLAGGGRRTALGRGGGPRRSPFKGQSQVFRQHRLYVPGDDVRRLDWRVLARTDHAFVREYDDESALRTVFVADVSGSMAYGRPQTKADAAARLIAALAYVTLAGGELAGVLAARDGADLWAAPASAPAHLARIVAVLEAAQPSGSTALVEALAAVAGRLGRRALVIVVSDGLLPPDHLRRGLARLRHDRQTMAFVRVLHPDEIDFPFRGWTRFAGLENEAGPTLRGAVGRNAYLSRFDAHSRRIKEACRVTRADYVEHVVGRPLLDTIRAVVGRGRQ